MKMKSNGRHPQNMECLSDHWLKFTHILNFSEGDKVEKISKLDYLKAYSKECDLKFLRGLLEENPVEISSVALLSPAY